MLTTAHAPVKTRYDMRKALLENFEDGILFDELVAEVHDKLTYLNTETISLELASMMDVFFVRSENEELRMKYPRTEADLTRLYPPDEIRREIRKLIFDFLPRGAEGPYASELAEEIAFSDEGAPYTERDIILEISRMMGTYIRMAPNSRLYLNKR